MRSSFLKSQKTKHPILANKMQVSFSKKTKENRNPKMWSWKTYMIMASFMNACNSFQISSNHKSQSRWNKLFMEMKNNEPSQSNHSRRDVLFEAGLFSLLITQQPEKSNAYTAPLFTQVKAIENANYIGMIGKPIYTPNVSGEPSEHMPIVKVSNDQNVEVSVPHRNSMDDYIQFIWLKDAKSNEVVLVKAFPSPEQDKDTLIGTPTLTAKVPKGVTLQACCFCTSNGLWKGEPFEVN